MRCHHCSSSACRHLVIAVGEVDEQQVRARVRARRSWPRPHARPILSWAFGWSSTRTAPIPRVRPSETSVLRWAHFGSLCPAPPLTAPSSDAPWISVCYAERAPVSWRGLLHNNARGARAKQRPACPVGHEVRNICRGCDPHERRRIVREWRRLPQFPI